MLVVNISLPGGNISTQTVPERCSIQDLKAQLFRSEKELLKKLPVHHVFGIDQDTLLSSESNRLSVSHPTLQQSVKDGKPLYLILFDRDELKKNKGKQDQSFQNASDMAKIAKAKLAIAARESSPKLSVSDVASAALEFSRNSHNASEHYRQSRIDTNLPVPLAHPSSPPPLPPPSSIPATSEPLPISSHHPPPPSASEVPQPSQENDEASGLESNPPFQKQPLERGESQKEMIQKQIRLQELEQQRQNILLEKKERMQKKLQEKKELDKIKSKRAEIIKADRFGHLKKNRKQIIKTREFRQLQELTQMCLMDLDSDACSVFFSREFVGYLFTSLKETAYEEDYTLQIELTCLLLAIHENFRKKFGEESNLVATILSEDVNNTIFFENAMCIYLEIFPTSKLSFYHSALFFFATLRSRLAASFFSTDYYSDFIEQTVAQLKANNPHPQAQKLYLEIIYNLFINTGYTRTSPQLELISSTLQALAGNKAVDHDNREFARRILQNQVPRAKKAK